MNSREIAERLIVLINLRCVEEAAPLILENSENKVLLDLMKDSTPEVIYWLFLGSVWGSWMHVTLAGRATGDELPTGLAVRIEEARDSVGRDEA